MNCNLFKKALLFFAFMAVASNSWSGPYAPAAGQSGSTAIAAADMSILGWATSYSNYLVGSNVDPEWQNPNLALNTAGNSDGNNTGFTFDIASLGRGGQITLTFDQPITNGDGFDFAIFENGFSDAFLELAWVEVSSNGTDFVRYPTASFTAVAVGPFDETMDASNIFGMAGKYRRGYGTPFDLELLKDSPNLDVSNITHIRIVDIIGNGASFDDLSPPVGPNPIYDPYPTSGSAGFDLDAVAIMHFAEPAFEQNVPIPFAAIIGLGILLSLTQHHFKQRKQRISLN